MTGKLEFSEAGVAPDIGGGFSTFVEGHVLAFHPHQHGGGCDSGGYTGAAHVAFSFFAGGAQGDSLSIGEAHGIDAEFEGAGPSKAALGLHLAHAAEGDGTFRDDHVILVDDGFGDFEIHRFLDVRGGRRDVSTETKTHGCAVLKGTHLGSGGE